MAAVTPQKIVLYDYIENINRSSAGREKSMANLSDNSTKGIISKGAKKRITAGINWMHALSAVKTSYLPETGKQIRFRLNMLTLTLASKQLHPDSEIKRTLLNRMLERLRDTYGMTSYLWRAEAQKNGNIHFHITSNFFIHHRALRDLWNEVQNKLGYIDRFEAEHGHRDPNSTDVHSIYKVKNLSAYLCKYMAKESEYRPIEGRQWYLSSNLSKIKPINRIYEADLKREVERFICMNQSRFLALDHASILFADIFTSNLSDFPILSEIKQEAISNYYHLINPN